MNKQIILNLPVKDLNQSKAFFSALGFTFSDRFSGENAVFMNIVGDTIQAMLTTEPFFKSLIGKPVVNHVRELARGRVHDRRLPARDALRRVLLRPALQRRRPGCAPARGAWAPGEEDARRDERLAGRGLRGRQRVTTDPALARPR